MRPKVTVNCAYCGREFLKYIHHVKENLKLNHRSFCSINCQAKFKNKQVLLTCENFKCGRKFNRQSSQISTSNYCSRRCATTINNQIYHRQSQIFKRCANLKCPKIFIGERKYCSKSCQPNKGKPPLPKSYNHEEILEYIQALAKKLGRTPTRRECPQASSARKYFGSWIDAVLSAGLLPHRSKSQKMFKRIQTYAKDSHFCYSISELLIDNWLTYHSIIHQKEAPYPESNFIADWSIPEKKIFIEYFGLANDINEYDITIDKKKKICQKYGIKLIDLYAKDLFPVQTLESKLTMRLTETLNVVPNNLDVSTITNT